MSSPYPVTFIDEYRNREKYKLTITAESKPYNDFIVVIGEGPLPGGERFERRRLVSRNCLFLLRRLRYARRVIEREYAMLLSVNSIATTPNS